MKDVCSSVTFIINARFFYDIFLFEQWYFHRNQGTIYCARRHQILASSWCASKVCKNLSFFHLAYAECKTIIRLKKITCRLIFEKSLKNENSFKRSMYFKNRYISFSNLSYFVSWLFWVHYLLEKKLFCFGNKVLVLTA